jgi:hypothetical protein
MVAPLARGKPMFTFHTDNGHGWLEVSRAEVLALGFTAADFSQYSYIKDGGTLYLEEDCDATKFVTAWQAKHGRKPEFREKHCNGSSHIRRYRRNGH